MSLHNFSRPRAATLLVLALLSTGPLLAFGTPTYIVYFDGQLGGTLVVENAPEMPEGACGLRVNHYDTIEWYWAEYNEFGLVEPMPDPFAGPPNSTTNPPGDSLYPLIELTGPFGDDCGDDFVFLGPSTGQHPTWNNGTPQGGGALVFQTLPDGVEWLTESFSVWEEPEDPGAEPDPDYVSVCEIYPDLCIEPGFVYEDPCRSNVFDCGDSTGAGVGAFQAADAVSAVLLALDGVTATRDSGIQRRALDEAWLALDHAAQALDFLLERSERLIGDLARAAEHEQSRQELTALQVAVDLATAGEASCRRGLKGLEKDASRATLSCAGMRSSLESVQRALDRIVAWTVPRDKR